MKRSHGTGYIFKRNNIYRIRFYINGKILEKSLKTRNRIEAEEKSKEYLPIINAKSKEEIAFQIGEARNLLKKKTTKLEDSWNIYLKDPTRPDSGEITLKEYHAKWKKFINNLPFSITYIEQIAPKDAQEYMTKLSESQVSNRTYNSTLQALKLVMKILTKDVENPFKGIVPKINQVISRKDFTKEEVIKIFRVFDNLEFNISHKEEMRVLFHIGCWTGLRLKDCALLKWSSINLNNNTISVIPYKVARKSNNNVIIPIHLFLKTELQKALEWKTDEFVLPLIAKKYFSNRCTVSKDCTRVIKQAGLDTTQKAEGINRKYDVSIYSFHSFRHSFVSFCAQAGVPMAIVQAIVGHGSPAMTKHYTHIGSETLKTAINALPVANYDHEETIREKVLKLVNAASDAQLKQYYQILKDNDLKTVVELSKD